MIRRILSALYTVALFFGLFTLWYLFGPEIIRRLLNT